MKRLFVPAFFLQPLILFAQHDEDLVKEKLDSVLSELDTSRNWHWEIPPFLKRFFEFLSHGSLFFRVLFYLLLAAIVLFGIYKLIGFFLRDRALGSGETGRTAEDGERGSPLSARSLLEQARQAFEEGDFSTAILLLHKGTVEFLYQKGLLNRSRDYTNREILTLVKDREVSQSFYQIALKAELILFDGQRGREEDFLRFEPLYRSHFL